MRDVQLFTHFLEGRFIPTAWLAVRLFGRYLTRKEEIDAALRRTPRLWRALGDLERLEPALYRELRKAALVDAVVSMPRQFDDDQLYFLSGRISRVFAESKKGDSFSVVSGRLLLTLLAVFAADAPALWTRGFAEGAKAKLKDRSLSLPARRLLSEVASVGGTVYPALLDVAKGLT